MADKRISQLVDRGTVANNDIVPIVVSGAVTTNKATISSIQTFMQGNLDLGVTSVGFTLTQTDGQQISVTGSPITTSGNITLNLPRATNSIRGLLDSEDFINFSNKQSTITLTTLGTSGAATLVSNTLNIPNYAQDLSGFVTLGTAQTITAQKTITTNGSSDTLIVNHTSGSGIGVNITKGGNGEGLIVNKTGGSGNAATITGTLQATTIVRTGGTSAQFLKADGSTDSNVFYLASNPSSFITLTSLSQGTGISYNSTTGVIASTITQYTDALARAALSFVAGSGAYNSSTGVMTIPTNNNQIANGAGYITGNQTITLSGDATGSGTSAISVVLANSGVTAGTYNNVATQVRPFTVDAKGRVTSIGAAVTITPAFSNVTGTPTTLGGYGITDAFTQTQVNNLLAAKQNNITLTTTGTSGAATLVGATINIPQYADQFLGTVTSVSGTGTVSGLTLSGTVTSSGNLTLGGTLSLTSNNVTTALGFTPYNATNPSGFTSNVGTVTSVAATAGTGISISGSPITSSGTINITNTAPDQTVSITAGSGISTSGTYPSFTVASTITQYTDALARASLSFVAGSGAYNSSTGVITIPTNNNQIVNGAGYTTNVGTVTSVAASAGTGISISGSPITSSGTLNITNTAPDQVVSLTASTGISVSGSYPNFTITNTSPSSGGTVTNVTASAPLASSGGATPNLSITQASGSTNGFLSSTDFNTFNNKAPSVAGGYLPLSGGTLTGALNGTSAVFSGILTANSAASAANGSINIENSDPTLRFRVTGGTANSRIYEFRAVAAGGVNDIMQLRLWNDAQTSASTLMSISPTGAATFSSSVTAGGGNSPTLGFQLTTTTGTSTPRITNDNGNATVIRTGASGSPVVINNFANSSELVRFTDSGNVGIGTATPTNNGSTNTTLSINNTNAGILELLSNGIVGLQMFSDTNHTRIGENRNKFIQFDTNNTERMRILSGGNTVIGGSFTVDTGAKLQVNAGDIGIQQGHGLRLVAPNGVQFRVTVNNFGTLITTAI